MPRITLVLIAAVLALASGCSPGPSATPSAANGTATSCAISSGEKLLDQDPSDSQSPWRRIDPGPVVINFETHAVTDPTYLADMAKGVAAWGKSPCIKPQLVDTCASETNCVHVVLKTTGPKGDDGNFDDDTKGGYTVGGTIEYYTGKLSAEGPSAQLNVVIHEMGHAVGLRHRLAPRALMNGNTLPDIFDPDPVDFHNLLVEYANQN